MLTVLVTNTKGGCGKTTIAINLAGAFANASFKTVIADCDRQKSSLGWISRRPKGFPAIRAVNWAKDTSNLPAKTQRLVIDAPAALRRKQAEELVRMADVIILPVLPSVFDENTTGKFLRTLEGMKPVKKGKRAVTVVGNRIRTNTLAAERLDEFLIGEGYTAVARLRDSQFYPTTALGGLSLFDIKTKRAANFLQDWRPLLAYIDQVTEEFDP